MIIHCCFIWCQWPEREIPKGQLAVPVEDSEGHPVLMHANCARLYQIYSEARAHPWLN